MSKFDYKPSVLAKYRSGKSDDPYISITQSEKIVNQKVILNELPSMETGVQIYGFIEYKSLPKTGMAGNGFYVDYNEGVVSFSPEKEGSTVSISYFGRGIHYISSSRIWTKEENGDVTHTLDNFISESRKTGRTAIIIAPSDANENTKKQADIILDGHADQIKINAAIQEMSNNPTGIFGEWKRTAIYFLEGKVKINAPIILIDGIVIRGSGTNTIIYLENGSNCDLFYQNGYDSNTTLYKVHLSDFLIDGNYSNNPLNQSTGIKIKPQEYIFERLTVTNCYRGLTLFGEGTYGGFISNCLIQGNYNYGLGVGGDSIVTSCGIGGNGNSPAAEWDYGASGVFLAGWNTQFTACHFASNRTDIFSNWTAYNQVQCCVFEAGLGENIRMEGRAWGWTIVGNRFGGRRSAQSSGSMPSISMRYIDSNEKAYGNIIANNSFTVYEPSDVGYSYCVLETENCDRNMINNNVFYNGYSESSPILIVGANTIASQNLN